MYNMARCFKDWIITHLRIYVLILIVVAAMETGVGSSPLNTDVHSHDACGVAALGRVRRVVNGREVGRCRYPWMVIIHRGGGPSDTCGATLISNRHVITAAHCFDMLRSRPTITIGEYNRSEIEPGSELRTDKYSVNIHPGYSNVIYRNDIAVVTLETPLDLSQYECLRPICLPEELTPLPVGTRCTVAGWGSVQREQVKIPKVSKVLQATFIPILEASKCQAVWSRLFFPDTHICAGDPSGKTDSCEGDSGGPLMCHDAKSIDKATHMLTHFLFGVVSLGNIDCAQKGVPAIYTDVRAYLPWIRKTMRGTDDSPNKE